MVIPPAAVRPVYKTSFSNDIPSRICVHELSMAVARVLFNEDVVMSTDVSARAIKAAHDLIEEMADLPRCPIKGAPGVAEG